MRSVIHKLRSRQERSAAMRAVFALPCFLALMLLDTGLHVSVAYIDSPGYGGATGYLFSAGWCVVFTGLIYLLPGMARRVVMLVLELFFIALALTHNVVLGIFSRFAMSSDLRYIEDAGDFLDPGYIAIRKLLIFFCAVGLCIMLLAVLLVPLRKAMKTRPVKKRLAPGLSAAAAGVIAVICLRVFAVGYPGAQVGDYNPGAEVYLSFTDTRRAMLITGLYQFTFRDLLVNSGVVEKPSKQDVQELTDYFDSRAGTHAENAMSGVFEGKNLILVQMEAIDYWMVDQFMPSLKAIKDQSIVFTDHYTPSYITAGTFNTEFIVQTGILPDQSGVPKSVYSKNAFPYSLPRLFTDAGYSANSFHGNTPNIYNRGDIHINLGFTKYFSGTDMDMEDYTLDSQLINGFDLMTAGAPFYSLVITYSGHGAYNMNNPISQLHYAEAEKLAVRSEPMYIHALAHSMETDLFVKELMEKLESTGLIDSTVVIFYSDHYDYYVQDTPLLMDIKGTDDMNLIRRTDFFIYSKGFGHMTVTKPTSTPDLLPTIANLFGLNARYECYFGSDIFGAAGGLVIFGDNSWYDGVIYSREAELTQEIIERNAEVIRLRNLDKILLKSDYFANN